jgi:CRP-like cAMP-binding protein
MDDGDLRLLTGCGTETAAPAGHMLIERGQTGSGLYVILEGSVVVEAPEGTRRLGAGAVIGERALLSPDGKRTARVRAATDVRLLAVERAEFDRLCADDAGFAGRIREASA